MTQIFNEHIYSQQELHNFKYALWKTQCKLIQFTHKQYSINASNRSKTSSHQNDAKLYQAFFWQQTFKTKLNFSLNHTLLSAIFVPSSAKDPKLISPTVISVC